MRKLTCEYDQMRRRNNRGPALILVEHNKLKDKAEITWDNYLPNIVVVCHWFEPAKPDRDRDRDQDQDTQRDRQTEADRDQD